MHLHIENFAKISSADVVLDGLTVISGDNNTGKSTIGKVLYSLFRGHSNIDRRIREERVAAVREAVRKAAYADASEEECLGLLTDKRKVKDVLYAVTLRGLDDGTRSTSKEDPDSERTARIVADGRADMVSNAIRSAREMSDDDISWVILRRVFNCVFHGQYHPLKAEERAAKIVLTVGHEHEKNAVTFLHDRADLDLPTKLYAKARLIATPDLFGYMNVRDIETNARYSSLLEKYSLELVRELVMDRSLGSVVAEAARLEVVRKVLSDLDGVIRGKIRTDERGEYVLTEDGNSVPTKVENLSMGMKSFALLRFMLEKGVLQDRDVLILDEPENHLHPEWQVIYANVLVHLQKAFDLTVLVTTHSTFFVNALQRFSVAYGLPEKTHFYLTKPDASRSGFYTLDDNASMTGMVFRSFNKAYDLLSLLSDDESAEGPDVCAR